MQAAAKKHAGKCLNIHKKIMGDLCPKYTLKKKIISLPGETEKNVTVLKMEV